MSIFVIFIKTRPRQQHNKTYQIYCKNNNNAKARQWECFTLRSRQKYLLIKKCLQVLSDLDTISSWGVNDLIFNGISFSLYQNVYGNSSVQYMQVTSRRLVNLIGTILLVLLVVWECSTDIDKLCPSNS